MSALGTARGWIAAPCPLVGVRACLGSCGVGRLALGPALPASVVAPTPMWATLVRPLRSLVSLPNSRFVLQGGGGRSVPLIGPSEPLGHEETCRKDAPQGVAPLCAPQGPCGQAVLEGTRDRGGFPARSGAGGKVECSIELWPEGSPLAEPPAADLEGAIGAYLDCVSGASYTPEKFAEAARLGTKARAVASSFPLRALRRGWTLRQGDHFRGLFESALDELFFPDLLLWLRHTATQGVDARYEGDRQRVRASPHPSLQGHLTEAYEQIWKDVSRGRVLLLTCAGDSHLLEGVVSVPLARVPKMLPNRTLSEKGRLIWDARRVNAHCDKTHYFPAAQPRHSEIARLILWWQTRFPHIPILLAKKDVSDAFKWLWIQSEDGPLFGADLPGSELGLSEGVTAVYTAMTFGWTGAPGSFMGFAWGVKLFHGSHAPTQPLWHDSTSFRSLMLMDDAVVIEPALGFRPWQSLRTAEAAARKMLGPDAINAEKDLEEGTLTYNKVIWGLSYDTRDNTVSLPGPKLEKAGHLLLLPDFDRGNTRLPLRLVQELRGNLEFWAAVLPTINPYLHSINALLKPPDEQGLANPRGSQGEVETQWASFWDTLDLLRLLAQDRASWATRFSNPLFAALDINEILALPGVGARVVWVTADATPTHIGAVDWSSKIAVAQKVEQFLAAVGRAGVRAKLEASSSPGPGEEEDCEEDRLQIALAELVALLLLCAHRRDAWKGRVILYAGDNQNVISWVRSRRSNHAGASFLLLVLGALEVTHGFQIRGEYVRTYRNTTADRLTREEAADVSKAMGLTLLSADPDWETLLEQGWSRRALVWAGQPSSDQGTAVQLALRGTHSLLASGRVPASALGRCLPRGGTCLDPGPSLDGPRCHRCEAGPREDAGASRGRSLRPPGRSPQRPEGRGSVPLC